MTKSWLKSYLENRYQRLEVNGVSSTWRDINQGVPQGSILGPLLFLIYINDMPTSVSVNIILFADDTNIETIGCTNKEIKSDLEAINDWLERNKLVLNLEKTVQMKVKSLSVDTTFYLNSNNIKMKPVCKYLGINLDRKLSFQSHIDYVKEKLSKQCGIVSKLRHYIQQKSC